MSDHNHGSTAHAEAHHGHPDSYYIKIWAVLMVLLLISIFGPFIGVWIITLITAFGVAFVKAFLVAKHFMHLNTEKPIVWYMLICCLAFMVLFFAAVSPDVMNHEGRRWVNVAAQQEKERGMKAGAAGAEHGGDHGGAEGAAPAHGEPAGGAAPAGGHP
ncbi:MAG: cytochrome C oxidase subunit IV family protein [Myxococcota bacterium]